MKGGDQFKEKKKKFSLNAGWVLLTNSVDYEQVLSNFKLTDMDPREIILLFNEKYIDAGSLPTHIKSNPKSFISSIISQLRIQKGL